MIPSSENKYIVFATVGDYYENNKCTYEKEIEIVDGLDSGKAYGIEIKCLYKKRRKISVIKKVEGSNININLYIVFASYHGMSKIDKYGDFCLRFIYNIYY